MEKLIDLRKPKFTSISDVELALEGKKIDLDKTMGNVSMPDFYDGPAADPLGDGIYIPTVYVSKEGCAVSNAENEYEIGGDDFVTVNVYSGLGNYELRLDPQCWTGDEAGNYGIAVDGDGTIGLYEYTSGICGGVSEITDLSEPLNAFVIEILMNTIVFEDPLDEPNEVVMYCPECGEDYHNGEELCPDCGAKLVTDFEFTMLNYRGLLPF